VDTAGAPLGATGGGANLHDTKLLVAILEPVVVEHPQPTEEGPQHLCLDKRYDIPTGHETVAAYHCILHLRRIGEETLDPNGQENYPARRWVVYRTLACSPNAETFSSGMRKRPSIS